MKPSNTVPSGRPAGERFVRHSLIPGFSQEALARSHLLVVGAGAIGNEVMKNLALLGCGSVTLIDFDIAEEHNLPRSVLLRDSDLGRPKVQAVAQRAMDLHAAFRVKALQGDLRDLIDLPLLASFDSVICAIDNLEGRLWLNRVCRQFGIDFYNAAIDHQLVSVEAFPFNLSMDCACWECSLPPSAYERMAARLSCGGLRKRAQEQSTVPTTAITASIAGSMLASFALAKHLGQAQKVQAATRMLFNTLTGGCSTNQLSPRADCDCQGRMPLRLADRSRFSRQALALKAQLAHACIAAIELTEAVILALHCKQCGHQPSAALGKKARRYDEHLIICPQCQTAGIGVQTGSRLLLDELDALGGTLLDAQFAFALNDEAYRVGVLELGENSS